MIRVHNTIVCNNISYMVHKNNILLDAHCRYTYNIILECYLTANIKDTVRHIITPPVL
jgi:hypothetical protein